jgi:hypothetical protein
MPSMSSRRTVASALVVTAALGGVVLRRGIGCSGAGREAAAKPPMTVTTTQVTAPPGTLAAGSGVRAGAIFRNECALTASTGSPLRPCVGGVPRGDD